MTPQKKPTWFEWTPGPDSGTAEWKMIFWRSGETNIGYLLRGPASEALAVDVTDGGELLSVLEAEGLDLKGILLTHGHHDHVNGLEAVCRKTGCELWRPSGLAGFPGTEVEAGRPFEAAGLTVRPLDTSGHSPLDFSYLFPDLDLCFCGDTLFAGGCGRLFAGPPERLWESLKTLRALPDDVTLCCGHDYADDNYRFASETLPEAPVFRETLAEVRDLASRGRMYMPVTVGEQSRTNLFLMSDHADVKQALGMPDASPPEVFARLRKERDRL